MTRLPAVGLLALMALACAPARPPEAARAEAAARGLAARLVPDRRNLFVFEWMPPTASGGDVFEVESRGTRIVIRGPNGVSMAMGLNWYLQERCHGYVGFRNQRLDIPDPAPTVPQRVRIEVPYRYRYFFNYVTFSYTMAWWQWPDWEQMIDWMALNGVNLPLAITGQEAVWTQVYRDLGLSDEEIRAFLVGPAYLPWGWMGNIDGLGGPLPASWIAGHQALEQRILARERALGMTPILQAFTGHVPASLGRHFPDAHVRRTGDWSAGFSGTDFLDPADPLFDRIGRAFIEKQTELYGTDHLYAADTFNEMDPPSADLDFLADMGRSVYGAMQSADPDTTWVLQGWFLVYSPTKFWTPERSRAFLGAVPDDKMIVLDLFGDRTPVWSRTDAFYGKPWIWNTLHEFGGRTSLFGNLPGILANLSDVRRSPAKGRFSGIGMTMEAFGDNPIVQDLVMDMTWRAEPPPLDAWVKAYVARRYGETTPDVEAAWTGLLQTVYRSPDQTGSLLTCRPGLHDPKRAYRCSPTIPYDAATLARAWASLLAARDQLGDVDTYDDDLVNVGRQVLSNLSNDYARAVDEAYEAKDRAALARAGARVLDLIRDLDALVGTRPHLRLGRWIADARRWGTTDDERRLYEWNARNLITMWGTKCTEGQFDDLNDYALRQWNGMFAGYDLPRWQLFLDRLAQSIRTRTPFDRAAYLPDACAWETAWSKGTETYAPDPEGDPVEVSSRLFEKYRRDLPGF